MNTSESQVQTSVLPEDVLIILPVQDLVLFPGRALAAAQEAVRTQRRVGLVLQTEATADAVPEKLYRVGTVASIVRFVTAGDGSHHLIAQG
jgi:ATP-dependent Lon protease